MPALHVVGVRHHSPACARLVAQTIADVKPDFVLIEGPADMNGRLDELLLGHELPIAIFSYAHGEGLHHTSWSPFCAYSPEWVALTEGRAAKAETLFIDLPAWDPAFLDIENRYSDRHARAGNHIIALCTQFGVEDVDALWDHLFEQALAPEVLRERLRVYFEAVRDEPLGRDVTREAYMARWIAWALHEARRAVVVVCGGFHAPAFGAVTANAERPEVPMRAGASSYLVPYSFRRLDSFVGYESGMPSPAFYQRVWEEGAEAAGERMLMAAVAHLREKKQRVSSADAIAALTAARGLRLLRGHDELARVDVLDGLATAIVKDALDAPLPWSRRGLLRRGTDPILVEIVAAFSGSQIGVLAHGTPHPPLVADAFAEIARAGITLERKPRELTVKLGSDASRVLHRLRVLGVPGFTAPRAPTLLDETWSVVRSIDAEAALIEAAAWGATLEAAAAARIEARISDARGVGELTQQLYEAARVGIASLARRVVREVRAAIDLEPSFAELGAGLAALVALHEHDVLLGAAGALLVGEAIQAAFDRGLWLFEGLGGGGEPEVRGAVALRDALGTKLGLDRARAEAVMARRAADMDAPPALRGAAFGFAWSHERPENESGLSPRGVPHGLLHAIKSAARPQTLGDFLAGLFALAREEVVHVPALLAVIDELVSAMTREDFLIAIPALRMAFAWFAPREKETISRQLLAIHGGAADLTQLDASPALVIRGMEIDAAVDAIAKRYGL